MSDLCISVITGSGYARAQVHFAFADATATEDECSTFGHRAIACIEMVPVLGLIVAMIDCIACQIFSIDFSTSFDDEKEKKRDYTSLSGVARETMDVTKKGHYTIEGERVDLADHDFVVADYVREYDFTGFGGDPTAAPVDTNYVVENKDVISAILDLVEEGYDPDEIAALNLANERSAGGGFIRGARAQEEDICRSSTLYKYLLHQRKAKPKGDRYLPEHGCMTSPAVIFRDARYNFLEEPVKVSIITTAAYCLGSADEITVDNVDDHPDYRDGTFKKIYMSIKAAADEGKKVLILGALGCGAFRNDPNFVSKVFKETLELPEFKGRFKEVRFAILAREGHPHEFRNLEVYKQQFVAN